MPTEVISILQAGLFDSALLPHPSLKGSIRDHSGPTSLTPFLRLLPLFMLLCTLACSRGISPESIAGSPAAQPEVPGTRGFTPEEQERINGLKTGGGLRAVTVHKEGVYFPEDVQGRTGFHYRLLQEFSTFLGLESSVLTTVNAVPDLFELDGRLPPPALLNDPSYAYLPDFMRENDLYAANITLLPWRERILSMTRIYPVKVVLVGPRSMDYKGPSSLRGLRVATREGTSYRELILRLEEEHSLGLVPVYQPEGLLADSVASGAADITLVDSDVAIASIRRYPQLTIWDGLSDVQQIGWAFNPGDKLIQRLFVRFLSEFRHTGGLDRLWFQEYGISLREYSLLIDYPLPRRPAHRFVP